MKMISDITLAKFSEISYKIYDRFYSDNNSLSNASVDDVHRSNLAQSEYAEIYKDCTFICVFDSSPEKLMPGLICVYVIRDTLLIIFRGTVPSNYSDISADADIENNREYTRYWAGAPLGDWMTIHAGFLRYSLIGCAAFLKIFKLPSPPSEKLPVSIMDSFSKYEAFVRGGPKNDIFPADDLSLNLDFGGIKKIFVAGHSLGGAAASLWSFGATIQKAMESTYINDITVRTFGAPPLGNAQFVNEFESRAKGRQLRYVNRHDPVPLMLNGDPKGEYYDSVAMNVAYYLSGAALSYSVIFGSRQDILNVPPMQLVDYIAAPSGEIYLVFVGGGKLLANWFFQPAVGFTMDSGSANPLFNHKVSTYIMNLDKRKVSGAEELVAYVGGQGVGKIDVWERAQSRKDEFMRAHVPVNIVIKGRVT
ncbi:hypothetical protein D1006_00875 [Burkholderia stabilis]|uniref:Fungal lipase-type domain-containing protein n=1 Tax=Burkholderia stabilis TaxID=95485 RepID=A0A4Q2ALF7_9BURK|nr:hypothetical protein [Burkholderia stabilis]RXV71066.1 hypothetical protein D1006_00875 [Burkholderia stabilis]